MPNTGRSPTVMPHSAQPAVVQRLAAALLGPQAQFAMPTGSMLPGAGVAPPAGPARGVPDATRRDIGASVRSMIPDAGTAGPRTEYISPTNNPAIRNDAMGQGGFGVPRRADDTGKPFSHRGIDLLAKPGDPVRAPIGGKIVSVGLAHQGDQRLQAVSIQGVDGLKHTLVYVSPKVKAGDTIQAGQVIGAAQDPSLRYGSGMKPHIYWRVERGQQALDPTGFIMPQIAGGGSAAAVQGQAGPDVLGGDPSVAAQMLQSGGGAMPPLDGPPQDVAPPPGGLPTDAQAAGSGAAAGFQPTPAAAAGDPSQIDVRALLGNYLKQQRYSTFFNALGRIGAGIGSGQPWGSAIAQGAAQSQPPEMGLGALLEMQKLQQEQEQTTAERQAATAAGVDPNAASWLQKGQFDLLHPDPTTAPETWGQPVWDAKLGKMVQTSSRGQTRSDAPVTPTEAKDTFTEPYRDDAGNLVQRSQRTGKIEILVKASEGRSSGNVVNVQMPDGVIKPFRTTDPALDEALKTPGARTLEAATQNQGQANKLRDDFARDSKDIQQAFYGYQKVKAAAQNPSAAGDLALIFGYMKLLDPTSVVREGEFATAQNSGGVPQKVVAAYNKVLNGERLAPEQRVDFLTQAEGQYGVYRQRYDKLMQQYTGLAKRSSVDPRDVFAPLDEGAAAAAPDGAASPSDSNGMPSPKSAAERDALPPGTQYLAPDGSVRTRQ